MDLPTAAARTLGDLCDTGSSLAMRAACRGLRDAVRYKRSVRLPRARRAEAVAAAFPAARALDLSRYVHLLDLDFVGGLLPLLRQAEELRAHSCYMPPPAAGALLAGVAHDRLRVLDLRLSYLGVSELALLELAARASAPSLEELSFSVAESRAAPEEEDSVCPPGLGGSLRALPWLRVLRVCGPLLQPVPSGGSMLTRMPDGLLGAVGEAAECAALRSLTLRGLCELPSLACASAALERLEISFCGSLDLVDDWPAAPNLRSLVLTGSARCMRYPIGWLPPTDVGAQMLAPVRAALAELPALRVLDLSHAQWSDAGVAALVAVVRAGAVEELLLGEGYARLLMSPREALPQAVAEARSLWRLGLSGVFRDELVMPEYAAAALGVIIGGVRRLELAQNPLLRELVPKLLLAVARSATIAELDLRGVPVPPAAAQRAAALSANRGVAILLGDPPEYEFGAGDDVEGR